MLPERLAEARIRGRDIGVLQREGTLEQEGQTFHVEDFSVPRLGQSMAFVMDTRMCRAAVELARGVDMLVCESTYLSSEAKEARRHGHLTAVDAATIAKEAGAKLLVLSHFSQRYQSVQPFLKEARAVFDNVVAAKDCKRVTIERPKAEASDSSRSS